MAKTIRMFAVEDSSNIAAVGYLADEGGKDAGTLRVRFSSGATYDYAGVGLDVLSAFQNAPSMGSYLAKRIKGQFATTKLAEPAAIVAPVPKALMDVVGSAVELAGPAEARWTLVDTADHRAGSRTALPIDVPEGRRVRIMAVMVEVTDGRGFPPDPVTPPPPSAPSRLTSPESPVSVVSRGERRVLRGGCL